MMTRFIYDSVCTTLCLYNVNNVQNHFHIFIHNWHQNNSSFISYLLIYNRYSNSLLTSNVTGGWSGGPIPTLAPIQVRRPLSRARSDRKAIRLPNTHATIVTPSMAPRQAASKPLRYFLLCGREIN